ncbi:histidine kinase, partial [Chryseosolibacter indicus]
ILKYPENTMRIELAGISYHSGRRVHYEYRLKELNVRWNKLFNSTIEFTALPFGEFTLEVRAVDRWGEKSTSSKRITIVNVPPFWKSDRFIWFNYLTIASFLATGFYLFHKKQQQKKEREYERRKKMHELEMKAFQAQINPHFIFNCLASIQYHIVRSDIRSASTYLHKFSTLIRQNLQHSTSSTILLREELKILSLYLELEKLRMGNRLEYEIIVSEEVQQDILHIPSMIVQPYVENAIKHGVSPLKDRLGLVVVRFMQANSFIECFIEDNGPGIMAKKNEAFTNDYISMGTSITAARIRTINDTQERKISVKITDKMAAGLLESGTIVQLSFPL